MTRQKLLRKVWNKALFWSAQYLKFSFREGLIIPYYSVIMRINKIVETV